MEECEPDIDFSVLKNQTHIEMISLVNIGLVSFDLGLLSNAERIGQIVLDDNEISEIDITPIIDKPMCAYHLSRLMGDRGCAGNVATCTPPSSPYSLRRYVRAL